MYIAIVSTIMSQYAPPIELSLQVVPFVFHKTNESSSAIRLNNTMSELESNLASNWNIQENTNENAFLIPND